MKPLLILSLAMMTLGSGCVVVPSLYSAQLQPAVERYRALERGLSRAEIEARLGKPTREEEGASVWETRFDDRNYALARVWFEAGGNAGKIEITKAHGKRGLGFDSAAVSTRMK